MKNVFIILLAASAGSISCQSPPVDPNSAVAIHAGATSLSEDTARPIPKPIASGDYFPDLPHHRAGPGRGGGLAMPTVVG